MCGEHSNLIVYSRKGKTQLLLSSVLSRDGIPISHEILPGSTPDIYDRMQIREDEKCDGKYILLFSDEKLFKEEIAITFNVLLDF
jgi:hypothetical protein